MQDSPISYQEWRDAGTEWSWGRHTVFYRMIDRKDDSGVQSTAPLLLIHGFPTCSWDWSWMTDSLAEHFPLIAPDLLDYGQSRNPSGKACSIHDQADMIEGLLEHLGQAHVHILAHDVGDTVAQELLARQIEKRLPFQILSCVFLNGGLLPDLHRPRPVQKALAGPFGWFIAHLADSHKMLAGFADVFSEDHRPNAEQLEAFWPTIIGMNGRGSFSRRIRYMKERRRFAQRWVGALKGTTAPLMLINGLADPVSGAHVADGFRVRVPDGRIARLAGIGHYPQVEAPDEVLTAFYGFHKIGQTPQAPPETTASAPSDMTGPAGNASLTAAD